MKVSKKGSTTTFNFDETTKKALISSTPGPKMLYSAEIKQNGGAVINVQEVSWDYESSSLYTARYVQDGPGYKLTEVETISCSEYRPSTFYKSAPKDSYNTALSIAALLFEVIGQEMADGSSKEYSCDEVQTLLAGAHEVSDLL